MFVFIVILFVNLLPYFSQAPTFINVCYPCRQAFVPFDDAKVSRFLETDKEFLVIVCANSPLF